MILADSPDYDQIQNAVINGSESHRFVVVDRVQLSHEKDRHKVASRIQAYARTNRLDHIFVSGSLEKAVTATTKVPLGNLGRSLSARPPEFPSPLLAVSDHCPLVADINL